MANLIGDINDDDIVDALDLSTLLSAWGSDDGQSDLSGNGNIGAFDLSILLSKWGNSPADLPATPANLTTSTNGNGITLSWDSPAGADSYNVKRATVSGGPYTTVQASATATDYLDENVTAGTTYYYIVSAVNSAGEGSDSAPVSADPEAVTAASIVQSQTASSSSSVLSVSGVFNDTATAGNFLVVIHMTNDTPVVSAPDGFTQIGQVAQSEGRVTLTAFYRQAAGHESSITIETSEAKAQTVSVMEITGLEGIDQIDSFTGNNSSGGKTSLSSGTSATTAQPDSFLIAAIAGNNNVTAWDNSWTNNFTNVTNVTGSNIALSVAERSVSEVGQYETTESWVNPVRAVGMILALKTNTGASDSSGLTLTLEYDTDTAYSNPQLLDGSTVNEDIVIRATEDWTGAPEIGYTDPDTLETYGVVWLLDGQPIRTDNVTAPWTIKANNDHITQAELGGSGEHTITVQAYFADGSIAYATASFSNDTSTQSAPVISGISHNVSGTSATITWSTDIPAESIVDYGTTDSYGSVVVDNELKTNHSLLITGLTPSELYHYRVRAINASEQQTIGADNTFTVPSGEPDTEPPVISNVVVTAGYTSATVSWFTNEPATSTVEFGETNGYGSQESNSELVTSHTIELTNLSQSTTYHFRIITSDAADNQSTTNDDTFTTSASSGITHGQQLTTFDVGPIGAGLAYSELTPSGNVTTESDGQVIENLDISGVVYIEHNNVTIRNCRATQMGSLYVLRVNSGVTGATVEWCEFVGGTSANVYLIGQADLYRCHIHDGLDNVKVGTNQTLTECYVDRNIVPSGQESAHLDAVQSVGGNNVHLTRCYLRLNDVEDRASPNGAIQWGANFSPISNYSAVDCFFWGWPNANYAVRIGEKEAQGHGRPTDITITGCVWQAAQWTSGPTNLEAGSGWVWSNNIDTDGNVISGPN